MGLISADEIVMGGMITNNNSTNTNTYLYTSSHYWTMTPYFFYSGYVRLYMVHSNGWLDNNRADSTRGVRPVINLKADTVFVSGNGEASTPLVVEGT